MFLVRLLTKPVLGLVNFIVRKWLSILILFAIYALFRFTGWSKHFNEAFGTGLVQEDIWIAAIKLIALAWLISFVKRLGLIAGVVFYGLVAIIVLAGMGGSSGAYILAIPAEVLSCFIPQDMLGITFFAILALYRIGYYFAPVEED